MFVSDSDEDSIVIKSTWRDRHRTNPIKSDNGYKSKSVTTNGKENTPEVNRLSGQEVEEWPAGHQPKFCTPGSSDDEFECLLDRIKNRTKNQTPGSTANKIQPKSAATGQLLILCNKNVLICCLIGMLWAKVMVSYDYRGQCLTQVVSALTP